MDIYVGTTKKHYSLLKKLLCYYPKYVTRCFEGEFLEAQPRKLTLSENKIEDFEILLDFTIHGNISTDARAIKEK